MSWKCDFCPQRIFTTKTSYINHIKQCLKSVDSSEELSLEVMMIDSLESENLLNNENNFESIHENSNEDESEGENEDEDNDSYNAEVEEESLTSDISHSSVSFFENMELSNSEPENYSFNNYASDYNNICEEAEPIEFPNNAYIDLMALVTNYNLSNEATNAVIRFFNEHSNLPLSPLPKNAKKGRELMEKMKIPTLTSKKHKILTHNNIDYYLFYHPVLNCIKNILSISDISQNFTLRFENFKYKGEKAYSEQYTGNWWKNTEASLPHGSNLLSIILYSDATTTDTLGKSSLHPIYISIGNISTKRRNKSDAKQLLGYLPILKAKDKSEKKSKDFKKLVRLTFHNSMKFLLDPLFAEKGIDLEVDNKTFWFFPRISTIICDWLEAATFSLVYKSTNSNFPCHFCLISKTLLADTDLSDVGMRPKVPTYNSPKGTTSLPTKTQSKKQKTHTLQPYITTPAPVHQPKHHITRSYHLIPTYVPPATKTKLPVRPQAYPHEDYFHRENVKFVVYTFRQENQSQKPRRPNFIYSS
ncbi:hypothetical protein Glove_415g2 [Diversispora epigaea]|uniref:C2H2-type domain-containing protein n=1 Tax=Diversispora epigaea TaxID=1348612 RepID=A0A397H151_9GLOM|nr:hypothetical protein Glove_415g2 [Diversispora epigaea]